MQEKAQMRIPILDLSVQYQQIAGEIQAVYVNQVKAARRQQIAQPLSKLSRLVCSDGICSPGQNAREVVQQEAEATVFLWDWKCFDLAERGQAADPSLHLLRSCALTRAKKTKRSNLEVPSQQSEGVVRADVYAAIRRERQRLTQKKQTRLGPNCRRDAVVRVAADAGLSGHAFSVLQPKCVGWSTTEITQRNFPDGSRGIASTSLTSMSIAAPKRS